MKKAADFADINGARIFVAGSTGLAGSSIVRAILQHYPDARITGSRYIHTSPFIQDARIDYAEGDLRAADDCHAMVRGCACAVLAAASTGGSRQLTTEPWKQVNDNLQIYANLLEACCCEGVKKVICVGSATLYQQAEGSIKEDELDLNCDPPPAYMGIGWVSRYIEKLCAFWHNQTDTNIITTRTSNIYGPYAKFSPATSNFIPALIRKAVDRLDPFEVWGSPDVTRDVIFADDFGSAVVALLTLEESSFNVFNIGSGEPVTVGEVVNAALKAAGHTPQSLTYDAAKPTTIKARVLDCSKIARLAGWKPSCCLETGIAETTKWWIENKEWWQK